MKTQYFIDWKLEYQSSWELLVRWHLIDWHRSRIQNPTSKLFCLTKGARLNERTGKRRSSKKRYKDETADITLVNRMHKTENKRESAAQRQRTFRVKRLRFNIYFGFLIVLWSIFLFIFRSFFLFSSFLFVHETKARKINGVKNSRRHCNAMLPGWK